MVQDTLPKAAKVVATFLSATEQPSLALWSERFFADKISKLVQVVAGDWYELL